MRIVLAVVVAIQCSASTFVADPLRWVQKPGLTFDKGAKKWQVTFELDSLSNVEVAIIDAKTGTVVRHLAAGVLGATPPPPLRLFAIAFPINVSLPEPPMALSM